MERSRRAAISCLLATIWRADPRAVRTITPAVTRANLLNISIALDWPFFLLQQDIDSADAETDSTDSSASPSHLLFPQWTQQSWAAVDTKNWPIKNWGRGMRSLFFNCCLPPVANWDRLASVLLLSMYISIQFISLKSLKASLYV